MRFRPARPRQDREVVRKRPETASITDPIKKAASDFLLKPLKPQTPKPQTLRVDSVQRDSAEP